MSLNIFVSSMFGIVFVIRILGFFRHRNLISENFLTKIGTIFVLVQICLAIFNHSTPVLVFICHSFSVLALWLVLFLIERRQIDGLRQQMAPFLDRWLLNMKMGMSVTRAAENALLRSSIYFSRAMQAVFESNAPISPHFRHFFLEFSVLQTLISIYRSNSNAYTRLSLLRSDVRESENFRHKSGRAVIQTRTQAIVMLFLQIAISIYVARSYGFIKNSDFILGGGGLAVSSFWLMRIFAKRIRWNI